MKASLRLAALLALTVISACNHLPDWMGNEEDETILPGERIALKRSAPLFEAEVPAEEMNIQLPEAYQNDSWNQALGAASGVSDQLALTQPLEHSISTGIGDGNSFSSEIIPAPVIDENRVFAMDGRGVVSAHNAETLELLWKSDIVETSESDDKLLGGGMAVASNIVYVANDEGTIAALGTQDGRLYWKQDLKVPLRSSPRVIGKTLLIQTADNQLMALNRRDGQSRWIHQGLNDQASELQSTEPAAGGDMVLATYSSGEVTALSLKDGSELWNDMLAGSAQTALQEDRFGALSALMTPRVSFAGSPKSFTAYVTTNGRRIWERRIPLKAVPWLAGTTLYMLTTDNQLLAVNGSNGKVDWVQNLAKEEDGKTIIWQHPIVASGAVWMVSDTGVLQGYNALTGEPGTALSIPDGVIAAPVIAGGRLYLVDESATLHALY